MADIFVLTLYLVTISLYFIVSSLGETTGCINIEREALIKFKAALIDPSNRLSSWTGEDCCRWKGVGCQNQTGNVVKIDLSNNDCYMEGESDAVTQNSTCLFGEINPSLLNLRSLNYLDLSMNNFQGNPIPEFLGSFKSLSHLNLSYASFGGMVPPSLGNLSKLQSLDLFDLHMWVSDLYWLESLSSLEYLNLGFINLSMAADHWLKALNMLPSLSELHLDSCNLHNIPYSLSSLNFSSLSVLNLYFNNINSPIPQWFSNFSALVQLDLSYNGMRDDISELMGGLSSSNCTLEELFLQYNQLRGQLPDSLGALKNLRYLYLSNNLISGSVPSSIGNLRSVKVLDLLSNQINGSIPESIGNLRELNELYLSQNSEKGFLSQNHLDGLKNLETLALSSSSKQSVLNVSDDWLPPFSLKQIRITNYKMGPKIPTWLMTQNHISTIYLKGVGISEMIPAWIWKLSPQLHRLDISDNQIRGMLPRSLEFSQDTWVDFSSNQFEGLHPLWRNVSYLNLANNLLSGSIPLDIGQVMPSLSYLNLSGNFLNGSIPFSTGEMQNLARLDLSGNRFSGKIHDNWGSLQALLIVDLSMNNLSGNLPSSIFSLPYLLWLQLNNNNLSGGLPFVTVNCTNLTLLDLGDNEFSGNLPEWIGESLTWLTVLRMRANKFSGNITEKLCNLQKLHILDLALNDLSGYLPTCLGNLSGFRSLTLYEVVPPDLSYPFIPLVELVVKGRQMMYTKIFKLVNIIDISSNHLQGKIPEEITELLTLGTLNLSRNQLTGKVPEKIGCLRHLESLDLSWNHLFGTIPSSMSYMTSLNYLNLSYNSLSGPIPSTNQFLTFQDPSIYEGNSALCGEPLRTKCYPPNNHGDEDPVRADNPEDEDKQERFWLFFSAGMGFVFGFAVVTGSFLMTDLCKQCLDKVFR